MGQVSQIGAGGGPKAVNSDFVRDRIRALNGAQIIGSSAKEFDAKYKADLAKFARIVAEQNIAPVQ